MLIDSSHKSWILVTTLAGLLSLGLYIWLDRSTPGGVTGGSIVGLVYALLGSALMLFAGLLAAHRKMLRWRWVPRRSWWLKGHIWLGLLSGVIIFCHGRLGWGGTFERVLWVVFGLTLATGILGVVLQQYLPRHLANHIPGEAPYEQIPHLCRLLRGQGDALAARICGSEEANPTGIDSETRRQFLNYYEGTVRPFLLERFDRSSPLAHPLQAKQDFAWTYSAPGLVEVREHVEQLEQLCSDRRQFGEQERLHHWLHAWLIVHVPLSVALLILGVAHALVALYY